jgi:hypothetical protein
VCVLCRVVYALCVLLEALSFLYLVVVILSKRVWSVVGCVEYEVKSSKTLSF